MSDEKKAFLLRVDKKLYDHFQKWADDELRSLNSQFEYVLRKALKDSGRISNVTEMSKGPSEKQAVISKRK